VTASGGEALLPTFFVIGAPKAGTTSLHRYLSVHPDIAMTRIKEPLLFTAPDWRERVAQYRELFGSEAPVRGESSTGYSGYPWTPEIPDRIRSAVPDARIVYVVRDPVPRTLSHYAQNVWDGKQVRPFDELMRDLEHPMNMPVWCSRYATQLERWLSRFGPDRVLVVDGLDLHRLAQRRATVQRIATFVGADGAFSSPEWDAVHNVTAEHRAPTRLAHRLGPTGSRAMQGPLRRLLTRPAPVPTLTPAQRTRLEALLAPEAARLREMTGLALSHWGI
jgi:hypothetical protein